MTVAQLVHPARGFARQTRWALFRARRRAVYRRRPFDAEVWRAIFTGLGFALVGMVMVALAIGATGVAQPVAGSHGDARAAAQAAASHRMQLYPDRADTFTGAVSRRAAPWRHDLAGAVVVDHRHTGPQLQ